MHDPDLDAQQQALAAIQALSADYRARLPARLDDIESSWQSLCTGGWDLEALRSLHRAVHGIKGSGKVFGLPAVSEEAASVEADLETLMERTELPQAEALQRVASGLARLRARVASAA